MLSTRILRRLAVVAAIGGLMIATSQANTPAPELPPSMPSVAPAEAAPAARSVRAPKKAVAALGTVCSKARVKLFVEGEGWIVRSVSRCA